MDVKAQLLIILTLLEPLSCPRLKGKSHTAQDMCCPTIPSLPGNDQCYCTAWGLGWPDTPLTTETGVWTLWAVDDGVSFSGVHNPWSMGHMCPRMAMNVAQHKLVHLLKTL